MCRVCEEDDKTSFHILCHWTSLQGLRKQYFEVALEERDEGHADRYNPGLHKQDGTSAGVGLFGGTTGLKCYSATTLAS